MPKVQVNQITSQTGGVLTVGQSGDTVTLATGATSSGFGRTGTVNWDTTPKTTTVTAVSGNGYFINTTSGTVTVNLPAGSAGSIVSISDYADTAATNNIIVVPNGTDKINGVNLTYYMNTNGASITLVYVDSTRGWKDVIDSTLDVTGINPFIVATGGTIVTCGNYKIHKFTSTGTFTVTNAGTPSGPNTVTAVIVGGGAGGSAVYGGGGGAGGLVLRSTGLTVSTTTYPITVGAGGNGPPSNPVPGTSGTSTTGLGYTAVGGGTGGGGGGGGQPGGSGGGGGGSSGYGTATQPSQSNPGATNYGNPGGTGPQGSGGGGAGGVGSSGPSGAGGVGIDVSPYFGTYANIGAGDSRQPTLMYFAGGGGGQGATGGLGGGSTWNPAVPVDQQNAQANTGGGGAGDGAGSGYHNGGSGIVLIKYKYQ